MTPNDRDFGRLEGKVDGLADRIAELREAVANGFEGHEKRIDSLESDRDRKAGRVALTNGVALGIASIIGAIFGSHAK